MQDLFDLGDAVGLRSPAAMRIEVHIVEETQFDHLTRTLSRVNSRRSAVAVLLGGLLLPLLPDEPITAKTRRRRDDVNGETWRHRKCPHGLSKCTFKKGKKKKYRCVDLQTDLANCGTCRNACPAGHVCQGGACVASACGGCLAGGACQPGTSVQQCGANGAACQACSGNECNEPVCDNGSCATSPTPGKSCSGDTGICDASGKCQPVICAGKTSTNPCFPRDASTCNTSGTKCFCGTDLNGINSCYENAYCNTVQRECTSNADCEAIIGKPGSICFSATNCCLSQTGCTTPCPNVCNPVCTPPQTCGGGGTPGVCGCTPTTCAAQDKNCGTISDGCGNTLDCGQCDGGSSGRETCGGGGTPNVCGCAENGTVVDDRDLCCSTSCCRDELPEGQCRCAGGCG